MKIVVRVDINKKVGTGHFFRVIKFLSIFKKLKPEIYFITKKKGLNLKNFLHDKKIIVKYIFSRNPKEDVIESKKIINNIKPKFIIVDNYFINASWEKKIKELCENLIVIDDNQNKAHICDYYINHNFIKNKKRLRKKIKSYKKIFLGPKYLIQNHKKKILHTRNFQIKKIAIFMGGYDKSNFTKRIINLLQHSNKEIKVINAFIGLKVPPKINKINKKIKINFLPFSQKFHNLLIKNDILISSGGTVLWDKCLTNIPSITIPLAENQKYNSIMLNKLGGTLMIKKIEEIPNIIKSFNNKLVIKMKKSTSFICDHNGLNRIKKEILNVKN